MGWLLPYITMSLLMIIGLFLILIILLQRGRGGGLAGALGGMGGQSAFGTKAGDMFTRITIILATVWMLVAVGNIYALQYRGNLYDGGTDSTPSAPALESTEKGDGTDAADKSGKLADDLINKVDADAAASDKKAGEMPVEPEKFDGAKPAEKTDPAKADEAAAPEKKTDEPKTEPAKDEATSPAEKTDAPADKPAEPEAKPDEKKPE